MTPSPSGEQVIATILKHDTKTTSYKIALLRALNDIALAYPGVVGHVAVPLKRIAELWAAYYWPFMDEVTPIYQGGRALRDETFRNDLSFRPAELWNLLPVDKVFNQQVKRDRLASAERLAQAQPWLARAYEQYAHSPALHRAIYEDATLRFASIQAAKGAFSTVLAQRTTQFIDEVATARFITRF